MTSIYSNFIFNSGFNDEINSLHNRLVCNLCFGHCITDCTHIVRIGNILHRQGLNAREFDIEMECDGNSVKAWIKSLSLLQMEILSRRIKLSSYCKMLVSEGLITEEQSLLKCVENYIICLQYYYYLKPTFSTLQKKMKFQVKKLEDVEDFLDCPICIQNEVDGEEKIQFQCTHSICNSCFHSYIDSLQNGFEPTCGLCREEIKEVFVKKEEYLFKIEKKYL